MKVIEKISQMILRVVIIFITICIPFASYSQKMSVESFELLEKDLDANRSATMKIDANGEKCALIKIQTIETGFSFDVGSLGIEETVRQNSDHPGEIWLYVPHGVKKISIQHKELGSINDYDLEQTLKSGKTYRLKLTTDKVFTNVIDYDHIQFVSVKVDPPTADFYINGVLQQLDSNGVWEKTLPYGTYDYRATAKNYYHEDGKIGVDDNKQTINIQLKPNFGYLSINGGEDLRGGEVYVDDNLVGTLPLIRQPIGSGKHNLRITKKLYLPYEQSFTISDVEELTISPEITPNYINVDISVDSDKDSEIYDNGEYLGIGKWSGRLESGIHTLEARKAHHYATTKEINLKKGDNGNITLDAPKPIYGSLRISTTPSDIEVWLDGKKVGVTPYFNDNILEGQYSLELKKSGFKTERKNIMIFHNQPTVEQIRMSGYCTALLTSTPSALLYVNGANMGRTPYRFNVPAGKYKVRLSAYGYGDYERELKLDGETKDINIRLFRDYVRKNEFYIQAGYKYFGSHGLGVGIGGYLKNINLEANFIMGFSESEDIYWYDTTNEVGRPFETASYKPLGADIKAGYGFKIAGRFRLTPQVGWQFIKLKNTSWSEGVANGAFVSSGTIGLRFHAALASCLGVSLTPEYKFKVDSSRAYNVLSSVSNTIKNYGEGFGANVNLTLFF